MPPPRYPDQLVMTATAELGARVRLLAEKAGVSQAEILRRAVEGRGLSAVEKSLAA
jgi:hypothetical protein